MTEIVLRDDNFERQALTQFTESAYLNYSMYVILDRALPHIGDGLKPVQRRIIYAMSELGLQASSKHKKAARTVGDVLGKFHPHGDSACYEAMVLMAQPFSYRYPLVDGQGNWGSSDDPKSFAAMRYTEAKLSKFAQVLLSEIGQGTVEWLPNFDGTLKEPKVLPAQVPSILLNGTTGIAVGMATDIPPHNLSELIDACVFLLDNKKASVTEVCEYVKGPDFPTDAEIVTPKADIIKLYETGNGSIRMRAKYERENGDVIITALPHQVSGAKICEQIAQQIHAKKLPMVSDLRDESDHENPTRLVITPRSNRVDIEQLMSHLFASTDLERSYRVNLNVIGLDGLPKVKALNEMLSEWLTFRTEVVRKRLTFRLEKILDRLHILDGLLIAFLNIDEVIEIIRTEDDPKSELISRFKLSDRQAEAILEIKLRQLAKLEEIKIRGEQESLSEEREKIELILSSSTRLKTLVKNELLEVKKEFGDERRAPLVVREQAKALDEKALIPSEPVTVILSKKGWVRCAKGHEVDPSQLNYKSGDDFLGQALGRSNDGAVFFDSTGKAYTLPAHTLASARGYGEPLTGRLSPPAGAHFESVVMGDAEQNILLSSNYGYGFITQFKELVSKNRNGKAVVKLPEGASLMMPEMIKTLETDKCVVVTTQGRMLVFSAKDLPVLSRGKGNKMMHIPTDKLKSQEELVSHMIIVGEHESLVLHAGRRHLTLKQSDLAHYQGERGRRGSKLPRGLQKVDRLAIDAS